MREWLRANGGAPALVIVGIGLSFGFWPVGACFIAVGALLWLNGWSQFPWRVVRESDLRGSQPVPLEDALPRQVTGKVVRVADLPPMVVGRTFERCEIWGPTPALIAPSERTKVRWLLPTPDSFIVVSDFSRLPRGTVSFIDCAFVDCDLQEFRTIGTQRQIDLLRAEFTEPSVH